MEVIVESREAWANVKPALNSGKVPTFEGEIIGNVMNYARLNLEIKDLLNKGTFFLITRY